MKNHGTSSLNPLCLSHPKPNLPVDSVGSAFKTYPNSRSHRLCCHHPSPWLLPLWLFSQPPLPPWRILNTAANRDALKHKFHGIWHNMLYVYSRLSSGTPLHQNKTKNLKLSQWPTRLSIPTTSPAWTPLSLPLTHGLQSHCPPCYSSNSASLPSALWSGVPLTRIFFPPYLLGSLHHLPLSLHSYFLNKAHLSTVFNHVTCPLSTTLNPLTLLHSFIASTYYITYLFSCFSMTASFPGEM